MRKQHDFTQGNMLRHLIIFSGPVMLTNLLQTSYQFADSLWVGNLLGASALGSVAISSTIIFTVLSFVLGLNNAALTILSQQKGRADEKGLKRYLNAFVVVLTVMALLLSTLGHTFAGQLLRLLGTPDTMLPEARTYLQIQFLGILFVFGYNFISTVLRSLGDSKTPLRFVMMAVLLNVMLNPLFMAVFDLGIRGAALATIGAQGSAFLYGLIYVLSKKLAPFSTPKRPSRQEVGLILNLGIPSGLQMGVISAGSAAIMSVVTGFGDHVVAGFGAAQRLDRLLMLPAHALGTSVNSMAGQNIGVRDWNRVRQIAKYGVLYNFSVMLAVGILVVLFAEYGVRLFLEDSAAVSFGTTYLQIIALCYPFLGINFILNGIVRASGAMYQVLALNIISFWVLRFPLAGMFSAWLGDAGLAVGMGISFLASSLIAFLYYRFGKWHEKVLWNEQKQNG
ncbi:MATE family efflux transporter [Lentibacillus halophilus]|uniref:MATE family efflux transporter n=1 Tax=Lentibacillus halophilus TaxID=295065 RepID=A0ABN0Z8M4_9BACI